MCLFFVGEAEICLVDERGGLERVPRALAAHVVVSQTVQLLLDQRKQLGERRLVTAAPLGEQLRDFVWSGVCQLKIFSVMSVRSGQD